MGKPGRPSPGLDDYLYWQDRLANRESSGLSIDEFCADEDVSRSTFYRWVDRLKDGIPGPPNCWNHFMSGRKSWCFALPCSGPTIRP